jgi:hypothetical protein
MGTARTHCLPNDTQSRRSRFKTQVVVWDRSGGAPIGRAAYDPGDDPKVIARRLLREKRSGPSGFYGPISYRCVERPHSLRRLCAPA